MARDALQLPAMTEEETASLQQALRLRRSVRRFSGSPLSLIQVASLLYATHGVNDSHGYRTVPSAGALFPLDVRLVAGNVLGLEPGIFRHLPLEHALERVAAADVRAALAAAAPGQSFIADAPAVIAISAAYERVTDKYGDRGVRYVDMEAGGASQNLALMAAALDLGAVVVGAFRDQQAADALRLPRSMRPLILMPVGRPG